MKKSLQKTDKNILKSQSKDLGCKGIEHPLDLNPHFLFNSLNAIQHFILQDSKRQSLRLVSIFSKLLRYYLKNIEAKKLPISQEIQMIEWYLELQQMRFEEKFTFLISSSENEKKSDSVVSVSVLRFLVEQILKEIFATQFSKIHFQLDFNLQDSNVLVDIKFKWIDLAAEPQPFDDLEGIVSRLLNCLHLFKKMEKEDFKIIRTEKVEKAGGAPKNLVISLPISTQV